MGILSDRKPPKLFNRVTAASLVFAVCMGAGLLLAGQDQQNPSPLKPPPNAAPPATQTAPSTSQATPSETPAAPPANQAAPANPPQSELAPAGEVPRTFTVPAKTTIWVRTSQFISSDRNKAGDGFNAELAEPVVINGWVVARRGQTILGRVAVAKKAGRIKGVSQLGLELNHLVLVDGHDLTIQTKLQQVTGPTSRGRDAEAVGTTTGIGAIIGGAAEGGEGAGIGAGLGAAAGLAGVLLTRGRPTVIAPESLLAFQLQAPITFSTNRSRVAYRPVTQDDYAPKTLQRRPPRLAGPPPYPPPPYYFGGYGPWGYGYPPLYFGFDYFGGGFRRGGFRR